MAKALGSRGALRLRLLLSALKSGVSVPLTRTEASFGTSVTSTKVAVNGVHLHYQRTGGIRDVSKWSEKIKKPLETLYGYEYFAKTCEKWVDGIKQFKHLPDGNICRHLLPLIQCPTLIVHGEKDPLVPRFHADFIHKHVSGSR
ncbi:biphenyl hydrolase like [Phyllostomus discolor]|uniref:Biphenyl hydrolase like n=1 Tax=Phyllostomus discolor TaxID=89673 RepID=A0A834AA33_9CHIR|nr:biphenyl hydrolase like [Phyllostomus discolor]